MDLILVFIILKTIIIKLGIFTFLSVQNNWSLNLQFLNHLIALDDPNWSCSGGGGHCT